MRSRLPRLLLPTLMVAGVSSAAQAEFHRGGEAAPSINNPTLSVEAPAAALEWSVAPRFESGWDAYDEGTGEYDPGYVHPRFVDVTFNTCASRGGMSEIEEIVVELRGTGVGDPIGAELRMSAADCVETTSMRILPHVATVRVTNAGGETASRDFALNLRDWLVVSLGDSLSSGEGVPDRAAEVRSLLLPIEGAVFSRPHCREIDDGNFDLADAKLIYNAIFREPQWNLDISTPADWVDRRCHRSQMSGPALAGRAFEDDDPHSSVTFVSLACSGATLKDGILGRYGGMEVDQMGATDIAAQIDALEDLTADRQADAIILSGGINDVGFSDIVLAAAEAAPGSSLGKMRARFDAGLAQLEGRFEDVAKRLGSNSAGQVYTILYPETPFSGANGQPDSCRLFESRPVRGVGLQKEEILLMNEMGIRLNAAIAQAARRHGWTTIDARDVFLQAGYCLPPTQRRLVLLRESCEIMGRRDGILHPNREGHEVVAERIVDSVFLGPVPLPSHEITMTIHSLGISHPLLAGRAIPLSMTLNLGPGQDPVRRVVTVGQASGGAPLQPDLGRFFFRVWRAPVQGRLATGASLSISGRIPEIEVNPDEPPQGGGDPPSVPARPFGAIFDMVAENGFGATEGPVTHTQEIEGGGLFSVSYEIRARRVTIGENVEAEDPGTLATPVQ